jgi:hypothetical protein
MRHEFIKRLRTSACPVRAFLVLVLLGALPAAPAPAQSPVGFPLVVPQRSLDLLQQLNRTTHFEVIRFSEVILNNKGTSVKTAVVNVSFGSGLVVPPRFVLFLPLGDLGLVQQLNQGLPIQLLTQVRMVILKPLMFVPSAVVLVSPNLETLPKLGPDDCLLVLPGNSVSLIVELNGGGSNFSLIRISQVSTGGGTMTTALIVVRHSGGSPNQGFSLILPEADLPALLRLNAGIKFNVVRVFDSTVGGKTTRLAEVTVTC